MKELIPVKFKHVEDEIYFEKSQNPTIKSFNEMLTERGYKVVKIDEKDDTKLK